MGTSIQRRRDQLPDPTWFSAAVLLLELYLSNCCVGYCLGHPVVMGLDQLTRVRSLWDPKSLRSQVMLVVLQKTLGSMSTKHQADDNIAIGFTEHIRIR